MQTIAKENLMSLIRRIKPMSETKMWWSRIHRTIEEYQSIISQAPSLSSERPQVMADRIKMLYVDVQHSKCPDDADEIYTYLTRSMINLSMSYESLRQILSDNSDIFYQRAMNEWITASTHLAKAGILIEV